MKKTLATTAMKFPFGCPVMPVGPRKSKANEAYILGAYPSALHVRWTPPGSKSIQALPVENEPSPFWTGEANEAKLHFERWRDELGWDAAWGTVHVADKRFNGSSGQNLRDKVLAPLGVKIEGAYISDCLNLYHMSSGVKIRLDTDIGAVLEKLGRTGSGLRSHPTENQIVKRALTDHHMRIASELEEAKPKVVVTLGNAALRVFGFVVGYTGTRMLSHEGLQYGKPIRIDFGGHEMSWYPLCHPGQRNPLYLGAHKVWAHAIEKTAKLEMRLD